MTKTRKRKRYGGLKCIPDFGDDNTLEMRSFLYKLTPENIKKPSKQYCHEKGCNVYVETAKKLIQFLVNQLDVHDFARDIDYTNLWKDWNTHIDTTLAGMSMPLENKAKLLEKTLTALLSVYSKNDQGDCTSFKTFKVKKCLKFSHQLVLSSADKTFDQAFDHALSIVNPPRIYTISNPEAVQGMVPADLAALIKEQLVKEDYKSAIVTCGPNYEVYIRSVNVIPTSIDFKLQNGVIFKLKNPVEQQKVSDGEQLLLDLKNMEQKLAKQ